MFKPGRDLLSTRNARGENVKEKEVTASPVVVKKEEVKKVVNPRSRKGPGTEHWSGYPPERSLTLLANGPFHLTVAIKVDPL